MNCRKSAKEHIQWTMEKKSLSSLFVGLSEPRYCYATKITKVAKYFLFIVIGEKLFGVKILMEIQLLEKNLELTIC